MSSIPEELLFTAEHEYIRRLEDGSVVEIGITDFAQGELGDVVFVELPHSGESFGRMEVFGTIEAVKAVSELFSPLAGEVVEANEALDREPALINTDPYGAGWMIRMRVADPAELDGLLTAEEYRNLVEG